MSVFQSPVNQDVAGNGLITSYYKPRLNSQGNPDFHDGIDYRAAIGTEVLAAAGGTIIRAGSASPSTGFGNVIIIYHGIINGKNTYSLYAHLSGFSEAMDSEGNLLLENGQSREWRAGDQVYVGQEIGLSGDSAAPGRPHLHFEILQSDTPLTFNTSGGIGYEDTHPYAVNPLQFLYGDGVNITHTLNTVDDSSQDFATAWGDIGNDVFITPGPTSGLDASGRSIKFTAADISGKSGNDLLIGNINDDKLRGGSGNDTLIGGAGSDRLWGWEEQADGEVVPVRIRETTDDGGNDTLVGGVNTLEDDNAQDHMHGGNGFDIYHAGNGDTVQDTDGKGRVFYNGSLLNIGFHGPEQGENEYVSIDGRFTYVRDGDDLIVTVSDTQPPVTFTIQDYAQNSLGIELRDMPDMEFAAPYQVTAEEAEAEGDAIGFPDNDPETVDFATDTHDAIIGTVGNTNIVVWPVPRGTIIYGDGPGIDESLHGSDSIQLDIMRQSLHEIPVIPEEGAVVLAQGGHDHVGGSLDNDWFEGGAGHDVLLGGRGDDTLIGGADNDFIQGSYGNDIVIGGNLGEATSGTDNNLMSGDRGDDYMFGGSGKDWIYGDTNLGLGPAFLNLETGENGWYGEYFPTGGFSMFYGLNLDFTSVDGGLFVDPLEGAGNDVIDAGGGEDLVYAGAGHDVVSGGSGKDTLIGEAGDDLLQGGEGTDHLYGDFYESIYQRDNIVIGFDPFYGTFVSRLYRDPVDTAGNDILDGGIGSDVLQGGRGDDVYVYNQGYGVDIAYDQAGQHDSVRLGPGISEQNVTLTVSDCSLIIQVSGADFLVLHNWFNSGNQIERIEFTNGSFWDVPEILDRLSLSVEQANAMGDVTPMAEVALTSDDAESIEGSLNNDALYLLAGDDHVNAAEGDDRVLAGEGDDIAFGEAGNDRLFGETGNDRLDGGEGEDFLRAGVGNDFIDGGSENDDLSGGAGNDYLRDTQGDERYVFDAGWGRDAIEDLAGVDEVVFTEGVDPASIRFMRSGDNLFLHDDGGNQIIFRGWFDNANAHIERISFADGTVWEGETLNALTSRVTGTQANDSLSGAEASDDILLGMGGNDVLNGLGGDDTLEGGDGDDKLLGGAGNDVLKGGAGNDVYGMDTGMDIVQADAGSGEINTVRLAHGVIADDVNAQYDGDNLVLSWSGGNGVTIEGYALSPSSWRFELATGAPVDVEAFFAEPVVVDAGSSGGAGFVSAALSRYEQFRYRDMVDFWNPQDGPAVFPVSASIVVLDEHGHPVVEWPEGYEPVRVPSGSGEDEQYFPQSISAYSEEQHTWDFTGSPIGSLHRDFLEVVRSDSVAGAQPASLTITSSEEAQLVLGSFALGGNGPSDRHVTGVILDKDIEDGLPDIGSGLRGTATLQERTHFLRVFNLGGGNDNVNMGANAAGSLIDSGAGDDSISFGNGSINDLLYGGEGNDFLSAGTGHDILLGGEGSDSLEDIRGNDVLMGMQGDDNLYDEHNRNIFQGGEGHDELNAGGIHHIFTPDPGGNSEEGPPTQFGSLLDGGSGNDSIWDSTSSDLIAGGRGDDRITLSGGEDVIAFNRGDGHDLIRLPEFGNQQRTLSLGGGIMEQDIRLERFGDDLVVHTGNAEYMILQSWYSALDEMDEALPITHLQVIDGAAIRQYDFGAIVAEFDAALQGDPALGRWAIDGSLAAAELGEFGDRAIGGNPAYQYGINGHFAGLQAGYVWNIMRNEYFGRANQAFTDTGAGETYDVLDFANGWIQLQGSGATEPQPNTAPEAGDPIEEQLVGVGQNFQFRIPGNAFSDADIQDYLLLSYTAQLADGSPLPSWLSFNPDTRTFSGQPQEGDFGMLAIEVTVTDTGGQSASAQFTLEVNEDGLRTITGTNDDDEIEGSVSADRISGLGGNDSIAGNGGDDLIDGGSGNDHISAGEGDDSLSGGDGNDSLYGDEGDDILDGGEGNDFMYGGRGDDSLEDSGGGATEYAYYVSQAGNGGHDVIRDTGGVDFLYINSQLPQEFQLERNGEDLRFIFSPHDSLTIENWFLSDDHQKIESIEYENAAGQLTTLTPQDIAGILGPDGLDTITGTEGGDVIDGTAEAEKILGLGGNDEISGLGGNDIIDGGEGDNIIDAGLGDDSVAAGTGDDRFLFRTGDGHDVIEDAGGAEYLELIIDSGFMNPWYEREDDDLVLTHSLSDRITIRNWFASAGHQIETIDIFHEPSGERVILTAEKINDSASNTITGSDNDDVISGDEYSNDIYGLDGNDSIDGGGGGDYIEGGAGSDEIIGGAGDDYIEGGSGNDEILGGDGNDYVIGGFGEDVISLGAGDDTLDFMIGEDGHDIVEETGGVDYLFAMTESATIDYDIERLGDDLKLVFSPDDSITIQGWFASVDRQIEDMEIFSLDSGESVFLTADEINDLFDTGENTPPVVDNPIAEQMAEEGVAFNFTVPEDTFSDADAGDALTLSATLVDGSALPSWLSFNAQTGAFSGTPPTSSVPLQIRVTATDGSSASVYSDFRLGLVGQTLSGTSGNDSLYGANGDDQMVGGAGNDTLQGNIGNDQISGDDGNDSLSGGAGDDIISGGGGGDSLDGGEGADQLDGGADNDYIYYTYSNSAVQIDLANGTGIGGYAQGDTLANIENIWGSAWNDTLTGNSGANGLLGGSGNDVISGGDGNDSLYGGSGADQIYGGAGSDNLSGEAGADLIDGGAGVDYAYYSGASAGVQVDLASGAGTGGDAAGDILLNIENIVGSSWSDMLSGDANANSISAGSGNDTLSGMEGNDSLYGEAGDDFVQGGDGNDSLRGDAGSDVVDGGIGNDSLQGGTENDQLSGGAGNDYLYGDAGVDVLVGGDDNDSLYGGAGADQLDGGAGIDYARYSGSTIGVQIDLAAGTGTGGDAEGDTLVNIENVSGSSFNDTLSGDASANTLSGEAGNDTVSGAGGDDSLYGDAGDDLVQGGDGNDSLRGDAGSDVVDGGIGNDSLQGGTENDQLSGGTGNDYLYGDAGMDVLSGGDDNDSLYGGAGADELDGGAGIDYARYSGSTAGVQVDMAAGTGAGGDAQGDSLLNIEHLSGSSWDDVLSGDGGANFLIGDSGNDTLSGMGGSDALYGDSGADQLSGGDGNDTLYGHADNDALHGGAGNDGLRGGTGSDLYLFGIGDDQDYATEDDGGAIDSGSTDRVVFGAGIDTDDLWFTQEGNHLRIWVEGTDDWLQVDNWYSNSAPGVEQFETSAGDILLASEVQQLVDAMAVFDPPSSGVLNVPQSAQDEVAPVIAANWS